jgi:hypothetical protein
MPAPTKSSHDTFDIVAQEAAREEEKRRSELRARIDGEDLKWLMRDKRGRRFVHGLLERSGVFRSSFHTNALTMAFNEGVRNEGLRLTARITEHCAELYPQMLAEQKESTNE